MKTEFDHYQQSQIQAGKKAGLDVSVYAKPEFSGAQMHAILLGLEDGLDVSIYADPGFDHQVMDAILEGLKKGFDVSPYARQGFDHNQILQILMGLKAGLDVSVYARSCFEARQMREIRLGLKDGLDVPIYASPDLDWSQMEQLRLGLKDGADVSAYANPAIPASKMWEARTGEKPPVLSGYYSQEPERPDAGMGIYSVGNAAGQGLTAIAENEKVALAMAIEAGHLRNLKLARCVRRDTERYLAELDPEAARSLRDLLAAGKPGVLYLHAPEGLQEGEGACRRVFRLRQVREPLPIPRVMADAWKIGNPSRTPDRNVSRYFGRMSR